MAKRDYYYDILLISEMQAQLIKEDIRITEKYCPNGTYYPSLAERRFGFKRNIFYTIRPIPFRTNNIDISRNINDLIDDYMLDNNPMNLSVYLFEIK